MFYVIRITLIAVFSGFELESWPVSVAISS